MNLSLGFSPCPNDTFIFDAMVHHKIDTEGLQFDVFIEDVEALNKRAFNEEIEITKLSYHAFGHLPGKYYLLDAGSALGRNCGPLLIAKEKLSEEALNDAHIAIPGRLTTANFLLSLAYPKATHKTELLFSDIENAVLENRFDAGLIIHENRFTYRDKGLVKIMDCGTYWETLTGLPIPLGGIVVRSDLPQTIQHKVNRVLRRSVAFAFDHPQASHSYTAALAQEMDPQVIKQHIELYVNEYSLDLGPVGRKAVKTLFEKAAEKQIINNFNSKIFLN